MEISIIYSNKLSTKQSNIIIDNDKLSTIIYSYESYPKIAEYLYDMQTARYIAEKDNPINNKNCYSINIGRNWIIFKIYFVDNGGSEILIMREHNK